MVSLERARADIIDRFNQSMRTTPEVMNGHHVAGKADFRRFFYENPDIKTMVVMDRVKAGFVLPLETDGV